MKVILSRKGFDSEYGGKPSPILPDGRLISLPIPSDGEKVSYSDLRLNEGKTYSQLMIELGYGNLQSRTCHLDPDIYRSVLCRPPDWKPIFGQIGAAQGHLDNQNVGVGDLFLFFGWFRHTRHDHLGRLVFDPVDSAGKHIIFGYLQVGEKVQLNVTSPCPDWMTYHPHAELSRKKRKNNTLYVAKDALLWNDRLPGGGVFCYNVGLVLTKDYLPKSCWDLPSSFKSMKITYHSATSWKDGYFQSANKGQEFVIQESQLAEEWAKRLI